MTENFISNSVRLKTNDSRRIKTCLIKNVTFFKESARKHPPVLLRYNLNKISNIYCQNAAETELVQLKYVERSKTLAKC